MNLNWCYRDEVSSLLKEGKKNQHIAEEVNGKKEGTGLKRSKSMGSTIPTVLRFACKRYHRYVLANMTNLNFPQPSTADQWPWILFAG